MTLATPFRLLHATSHWQGSGRADMSRSRKKNPAGGVTTAASDKDDKTRAHQRTRRAAKQVLRAGEEYCPDRKTTEQVWSYAKDGKAWYGPGRPELMRK